MNITMAKPLLGQLPIGQLIASVDGTNGADHTLDRAIAQAFQIEVAEFTGSVAAARRLVHHLLPMADLKVGYDVCGIFPSATIRNGSDLSSEVAPTVPMAILRALMHALGN